MTLPPVVILAGGFATRISKIDPSTPKAMLPILEKPFLFWKLRELADSGIKKIYILTGHLASSIELYVQSFVTEMELIVIRDRVIGGGTSAALRDALDVIVEECFVLTYGDNLLPLNIKDFTQPIENGICRMVVTSWCGAADSLNISLDGELVARYSKTDHIRATHVDFGYAFLNKESIRIPLTAQEGELGPFFDHLAQEKKLEAFVTTKRYLEIGTPETYQETKSYLEKRNSIS